MNVAPVPANAFPAALSVILATPGAVREADPGDVNRFIAYLDAGMIPREAWQVRRGDQVSALLVVLLPPGRTTIVMPADPGAHGIVAEDQAELLKSQLEQLRPRRLHYAQALVEPQAAGLRKLLEACVFRRLTALRYMERDARAPPLDPVAGNEVSWVALSQATQARFESTLLATYEGSLDCPELAGLRPVQDVLAAHRAAGRFDPSLWEIAQVAGTDAGCIFLTTLPHGLVVEVVYMGVTPAFRRRGVGRWLLWRALQQCRRLGGRSLTLAVDERNWPARRLYERVGFGLTTVRDAYLYEWA